MKSTVGGRWVAIERGLMSRRDDSRDAKRLETAARAVLFGNARPKAMPARLRTGEFRKRLDAVN